MNILFFLTPKCEVAYIYEDETLRQALEKMEYHKYSAVPIISRTGRYIGTITEGDMLWGIKNKFNLSLKEAERVTVAAIDRRLDNRPVYANSNMEDLIDKALNQNFVPVVDDQKNFIGIITRKDIIRTVTSVTGVSRRQAFFVFMLLSFFLSLRLAERWNRQRYCRSL